MITEEELKKLGSTEPKAFMHEAVDITTEKHNIKSVKHIHANSVEHVIEELEKEPKGTLVTALIIYR